MTSLASPRGFTLFETLIATGILVTALAGVAHLFILSSHLTQQANIAGAALSAAQDKIEILSGVAFDYDSDAQPVTDPSLAISPASSLDEDRAPFVDWIGPSGESHDKPENAIFARRWKVTSITNDAPDAVVVEVCVFRMPSAGVAAHDADACLSTVRTRQP